MRISRIRNLLPALFFAGVATLLPGHGAFAEADDLLLGPEYPIEVAVPFPAALLHWLDSLASLEGPGQSGGKTMGAHADEYLRAFGEPGDEDRELLEAYGRVRFRDASLQVRALRAGLDGEPSRLLSAFLEADTLGSALAAASELIPADDMTTLRATVRRFEPRYRRVWENGIVPRRFLRDFHDDPRSATLRSLLLDVARFYGVDPRAMRRPRVVLVPVPSGAGTHAQAIGRTLLLEIRPPDGLPEQASVLVHENAHFLFAEMDPARREALKAVFGRHGPDGRAAWGVLREALPTALGQGVADRLLRPDGWSMKLGWYHREEVDRYAKAIYSLVRKQIASGGRFDEVFAERLWERYPRRLRGTRDR